MSMKELIYGKGHFNDLYTLFQATAAASLTELNSSGFVRVLENLESPGILLWHFPGLESPRKRSLVLESSGNLLNSTKTYEVYRRQLGELTLRSWECRVNVNFRVLEKSI